MSAYVFQTDLEYMSDVRVGDSDCHQWHLLNRDSTLVAVWYAAAHVSRESLNRTTLEHWKAGQAVNAKKAMLPTTRFGGHIVSGHVDAVGEITRVRSDARSIYFEVTAPKEIARYFGRERLSDRGWY